MSKKNYIPFFLQDKILVLHKWQKKDYGLANCCFYVVFYK